MDVALFHHLPAGGGAPRVLVEYVRRASHDFTIYTRRPPQDGLLDLDSIATVRRFPQPVPRGRIGHLRALWNVPAQGREVAAAIDAGGHDVVFCHASTEVQAPEVLPYLRTPSLYYAPESLRLLLEPQPAFERLTSVRARLTERGLNPLERKRVRLNDAHVKAADAVVTHSHFTARTLRDLHGVDAAVVPLGVDANDLTPADVPREGFVLAVGALHPLKGHQFVIEALATLPASRPRLVVVCDRGTIAEPLRALARSLGVELELRPQVPFAELVDLFRRAGVLACGQIREPFGLTPLEAMATATPVVAVAEGGFTETVRDGETGLLVPRDPVAFGAALARVLGDPALAARLGRRGREVVETEWTWDRTVRGYDAELEALARG